jgi:hypothetical protein
MLIVMESHATEEQIRAVCERVESLGLKAATTARVIARENSRADRTVVVSFRQPDSPGACLGWKQQIPVKLPSSYH